MTELSTNHPNREIAHHALDDSVLAPVDAKAWYEAQIAALTTQIETLEKKNAALAVENVGVYSKNRLLEEQIAKLRERLRPSKKAGNLIADLRDAEFCAGKAGNEYDQDAERHAQAITDYLAAAEDSVRDLTAQTLRLTNENGNLRELLADAGKVMGDVCK